MSTWAEFRDELNRWHDAGKAAALWWRDDDAADVSPAVEGLLGLAGGAGVPLHMAVVPAAESASLSALINSYANTWVLQHGYSHANYARPGEGGWELGDHRRPETVQGELRQGFARLTATHGARFLQMLVPPWNRIAPPLLPALPGLGFRGLSRFGARQERCPVPGLVEINSHCDPIMWKGGARFRGTEEALRQITGHLAARRLGRRDPSEPTGLLTHHLDMDEAAWAFVERLVGLSVEHPAARWIALGGLLEAG